MSAPENPVNVVLADSQFLVTESLKHILKEDMHFRVCSVVMELKELTRALVKGNITLLIIDPSFIELSSFSELKEIRAANPHLLILIITNGLTRNELIELNSMGINDAILKTAGREEISEALSATLKGKRYYSNELLELLFDVSEKKNPGEETGQLTNTEMEIVRLIADGLTTKQIAARKYISFHTVITHRKNIFRKLGVTSVSELIIYAIRAGWIDLIEYHI